MPPEMHKPKEGVDSDYVWLKTHLAFQEGMASRESLANRVTRSLEDRMREGALPYTLGIFGGWGTGKTTFLAMLADKLERNKKCKVVYFNSWKYAGFMEIVPALIYKILQYGLEGEAIDRDEAARRVILGLGKKYGDQIGSWAKSKIGVDPVDLFKDLYEVSKDPDKVATTKFSKVINPEVVRAYYTQVDKAQDELRKALGTVTPGKPAEKAVIVLIDELDRCDPDEAFNLIKQMRVLFGMRDLPVAFVIGANPEPIGLAIRHRYGLDSDTGEYESRRILEKFVDAYEDLSVSEALGPLIKRMWNDDVPWIIRIDEANARPAFEEDEVMNATAFDAITTAVPLFSNIRVLYKSYDRVRNNNRVNAHLLWTKWFLEISTQIDPRFRRDLRRLTGSIEKSLSAAYESLGAVTYQVTQSGKRSRIEFDSADKGNTVFSIFRSFFWEKAKNELQTLRLSKDPEDQESATALQKLLSDPLRVDVVVLLSLLPFRGLPSFEDLCKTKNGAKLPDFHLALKGLIDEFGNTVAS